MLSGFFFASTRPVQIATNCLRHRMCFTGFASTRPVQIATSICVFVRLMYILCLHTPRADCNLEATKDAQGDFAPLPPHAPCRLQRTALLYHQGVVSLCLHTPRADCNTCKTTYTRDKKLCLHTPRADCNRESPAHGAGLHSLPPHAPCRLQRQKCTELQYTLFSNVC